MRQSLKQERGYSLVEVLVSIIILTVAIIPMVTMFDSGLRSATTSGNYDKARSLANKQLERAKNMPYDEAKNKYPSTTTTTYASSGRYPATGQDQQTDPDSVYSSFRYNVVKQCVSMNSDPANKSLTNVSCTPDPGMVRITVIITWGDNQSYTASGVVGK